MSRSDWTALAATLLVIGAFYLARRNGRAQFMAHVAAARAEGYAQAKAEVAVSQSVQIDARTAVSAAGGGDDLGARLDAHLAELRRFIGAEPARPELRVVPAALHSASGHHDAIDHDEHDDDDDAVRGTGLRGGGSVRRTRVGDGVDRVQVIARDGGRSGFLHVGRVVGGHAVDGAADSLDQARLT